MYYRVGLYRYMYDQGKSEFVQTIIVKKGLFSTTEIFTDFSFPKLSEEKIKKLLVQYDFLYIRQESFTDNSLASLNDVSKYIDNYDVKKFNKVIEDDYFCKLEQQKNISKYLKSRKKGVGKND